MPINQGAYLEGSTDLREGEIVMAGVTTDQLSGWNADAVILPFGRGCIFAPSATGTHERAALILPTTAGQIIRGVLVATDTIERRPGVSVDGNGNPGYPLPSSGQAVIATYATKGMIAVRAIENVTKGDAVTCVITVGPNQGVFGRTANASQIACPTTWEWATTTASGGIGILYIK